MSLVFLLLGFALLVWGADHFVLGGSVLAKKLGIPSLIVGLTVVAFGTSAPELAVSLTASLSGSNEIALGNVLGSNIFNLLLIVGVSAIISPLICDKQLLKRDWSASIIATTVLLLLIIFDGDISVLDGICLLAGFILVIFIQIYSTCKNNDEMQAFGKNSLSPMKIAFHIIFGLAAIIIGGNLAVDGACDIARMFGFSETLIGLTIVAIGTSLPELVTSVVATKRGEKEIAIGNVIGSNLFNILFILGLSCTISPITIHQSAIYDTAVLLFASVFMFILAKMNKLSRKYGIILVLLYIAYTAYIIMR